MRGLVDSLVGLIGLVGICHGGGCMSGTDGVAFAAASAMALGWSCERLRATRALDSVRNRND